MTFKDPFQTKPFYGSIYQRYLLSSLMSMLTIESLSSKPLTSHSWYTRLTDAQRQTEAQDLCSSPTMICPCLDKLLHHWEKVYSDIWYVKGWLKKVRGNTSGSVLITEILHTDNVLSFHKEGINIPCPEKDPINSKNQHCKAQKFSEVAVCLGLPN